MNAKNYTDMYGQLKKELGKGIYMLHCLHLYRIDNELWGLLNYLSANSEGLCNSQLPSEIPGYSLYAREDIHLLIDYTLHQKLFSPFFLLGLCHHISITAPASFLSLEPIYSTIPSSFLIIL